jgi:O-antigen/teichoic acid export membrane protein
VSSILALPFITPFLTEVDYGVWGLIQAYIGLTQAFAFLGLYVTLSNSFYNYPNRYHWIWRQLYGFLSLWMPMFGVLNGIFIYLIIPTEAQSNALNLAILSTLPLIVFGPVARIGEIRYQLQQNAKPIAIRASIIGILGVCLNVYTIRYLKLGYMGWAWSNFVVTIIMNATYWFPLVYKGGLSPIFNFKWSTIKRALHVGVPTIPHKYASYLLNSSDRLVLDRLNVATSSIGGYNLANSFGGYFNQLAVGLEKALSPVLLQGYSKGQDSNKSVYRSFVILLSLAFLYGTWAKEVFWLLIQNDALRKYYPLSIVLVISYTYRPFYSAFITKVMYSEQTKFLWLFTLSIGLLNIGLNFIFVPIFGYVAVAYVTLGCYILLGFGGFFIKGLRTNKLIPTIVILKAIISMIMSLFLALLIVELDIFFKLAISTTLLGGLYYYFYGTVKS